ncbi:MAG TPA: peptidylprolyl isomerase [Acidobacteriota bacterium]|jgi:peptidyl-prolyl cis-trans isomerase D|nr:peptidylprolyl isomerase [Acidobacteriota bacterium]
MLDLMRRARKQLNWILWLVIIGLGAGMVLLFVDRPGLTRGPLGYEEVASVEGNPITAKEFRQNYQRLSEIYRQAYNLNSRNSNLLKALGLDKQVLNQLVSSQVILLEAAKMGISASNDEVAEVIYKIPSFQENGNFIGSARYEQILRSNNRTPAEFEEDVRKDIVREKFQSVVTDGVTVSPEEVKKEYVNRNQEAVIQFVAIDPAEVEKTLQPSDNDLKAYFDQSKTRYRAGEQRKIEVIIFDVGQLASQQKVSDEELKRRFQANPEEEEVRASHILFKVEDPSKDTEARKQAEKVLAEARQGADFTKLAEKHSQDPGSKSKGGDLGYFKRGDMVPEFSNAAFSLPAGKISDLIKSQYGYHIIKVTDKRLPTFESKRTLLEIEARREMGEKIASDQANKAYADLAANKKDFNAVAKQYGGVVMATDFFAQSEPIPTLGTPVEFTADIFQIKKKGDIGKPFKAWRGWLIPRLMDTQPPHQPDFLKVRDKVLADYKRGKAQDAAQQRAVDIAKAAKDGNLEAGAKKYNLSATTTKPFKKDAAPDPALGSSPEISSKAFSMNPGEVSQPILAGSKYVVFKLKEKSTVDMAKFETEKENMRQSLLNQKKNTFFASYVGALVEKRKAENKITINQTLIDQIAG